MGERTKGEIFNPLTSLHWKECAALPAGVQNAQCVLLNDKIYVGVGLTSTGNNSQIFESTVQLDKWQAHATPVYCYALTVFNSRLTIVGGLYSDSIVLTNRIWTSLTCTHWELNMPKMPTKRCHSTAVSMRHPQCLIVAGGRGKVESDFAGGIGELSTVEVFKDYQWYSVRDLPAPCCKLKFTVHRGILYLMGGVEQGCAVFSCDMDLLLLYSRAMWKDSIMTAPLTNTCPVVFGDHLVAVGGSGESSAQIHGYFGCIHAWKEIGSLPIEVYDAASLVLPSGEMVVVGGFSINRRSSKVYKSSLRVLPSDVTDLFTPLNLYQFEESGVKILTSLSRIDKQFYATLGITDYYIQGDPMEGTNKAITLWILGETVHSRTWKSLLQVLEDLNLTDIKKQIEVFLVNDKQKYMEAYRQTLATKSSIDMLFVKVIFLGAPRLGKTTMRRRLTGEIDDIDSAGEPEQPSTGAVEAGHNVIIRNLSSTTAVVTPSEWSATKDLSEEANMLLQFFYQRSVADSALSPDRDQVCAATPVVVENIASSLTAPKTNPATTPFKKRVIKFFRKTFHIKKKLKHRSEAQHEFVRKTVDSTAVDMAKEITMSDDEIFDFFTEALSRNWEEIKFLLENTALLNMSDTGGQPEFMDMLPALVIGPALYLIFCKLNQPLQSHYTISYLNPSSLESTIPMQSTYTVEEVMFQALSAITCLSTSDPSIDDPLSSGEGNPNQDLQGLGVLQSQPSASTKSKAFIVGTHKDLVTEAEIEAFDAEIQKRVRATDFFSEDVIQFASENRLVLPIDNKSGGAEEISRVRKFLEEQMQQIFSKLSIPAAWLVFSLCLRKRPERTTSLQDCLLVAQQLDMSPGEAKLALWFLHHYAGVLMYFPDLPELHDTVINDIQVVYDSVTNLIVNTFKFGRVSKAASERFRETGQFCFGDIRQATATATGDFIPLRKLVRLLEHLHIVAPVNSADITKTVYLMPCVLQNATDDKLKLLHETTFSEPVLPLMVRYICGFVPIGVFPALIANLVGQTSLKLIVEGIKKNRVQFRFGTNRDIITFISRPKHYEIRVSRLSMAKVPIHEVCEAVLEILQSTLQVVTSRLNYPFSLNHQLSFECPLHPGGEHLCVVDSEETSPCFMDCLHNPKNPEPVEMEARHLVWFGKPLPCGSHENLPAVECQVLLEYHERLVIGLQSTISSVSASCYSHYLISEDTHRAVLELNLTNADKAIKLLLNVKQTIEQRKDMFQEFIAVLDDFESCRHLVEGITNKMETLLEEHDYQQANIDVPFEKTRSFSPCQSLDISSPESNIHEHPIVSTSANLTLPSTGDLIMSLPACARPHLEFPIDQPDSEEIAGHLVDWEKNSPHFGLTIFDSLTIKGKFPDNPIPQRHAVLEVWRRARGKRATYGDLLELLVAIGQMQCARVLCDVLRRKYPTRLTQAKHSLICNDYDVTH